MIKTTRNIFKLQLSYKPELDKIRGVGQNMEAHYEVSNLKKKAFSNMNFVSYG